MEGRSITFSTTLLNNNAAVHPEDLVGCGLLLVVLLPSGPVHLVGVSRSCLLRALQTHPACTVLRLPNAGMPLAYTPGKLNDTAAADTGDASQAAGGDDSAAGEAEADGGEHRRLAEASTGTGEGAHRRRRVGGRRQQGSA